MINGWFPSINSRGEIVSGAGEIFYNQVSFGRGTTPRWINDDEFVFNSYDVNQGSTIINVHTGERRFHPAAFNNYSAGSNMWSGIIQAGSITTRLHDSSGNVLRELVGCSNIMLSPTSGRYAYLTDFHSVNHRLICNNGIDFEVLSAKRNIMAIWRTDSSTIVTQHVSTYGRSVVVVRDEDLLNPIESSIQFWEDAYGCDGPDGFPWVLSVLQNGIMFRRAGSVRGHFLPGDWFNPYVRFINNAFLIVASGTHGQLLSHSINPEADDIDLKTIPDPSVTPIDPPPPPKETEMTDLTEAELRVLEAIGEKFPNSWHGAPGEEGEENARQFSIKCAQQMDYSFPDRNFGVKKADGGRPISKDSLARKDDDLIESWDIIGGASTGRGTFNPRNAGHHNISDQLFVEVEPKNWLGIEVNEGEGEIEVPPAGTAIAMMLKEIKELSRLVDTIQAKVLKSGDRIALRLDNGLYVSFQNSDSLDVDEIVELQTRHTGDGSWEMVTIEKK